VEYVWVLFALVCAFSLATSDALIKKALPDQNEYIVAWLRLVFALPLLLPLLFIIPIPRLDSDFFITILIALPLEITAVVLYIKALKLSPLSLTLPFLSLTPVFLIIIPRVILGETLSFSGILGVILIAAGGYLLNIRDLKKGILEPFYAIGREKGSVYMIIVALIYGFTSTLGKKAILDSSPLFFSVSYYTLLTIALTPLVLLQGRQEFSKIYRSGTLRSCVLPGLLYAVTNITHVMAISMTKVAYMISVKRLSLVIGVYYGYLFFKEAEIQGRLAGTALMVAGFAMIVMGN
jgi:drug/metabolite transporter (DMT)-like permease